MQQARDEMNQTGSSAKRASKDIDMIQKAALAVGAAVVGALTYSVKTAADFEHSMARVKAISGATGEDFEALKASAKQLGETTAFSASQAAEGMQYLAMAGFQTKDIIASMPGVLNLAAAAQIDLGRSADIVSNIMTGFGLAAEDTGRAVDVLVKTMTTANTDLPQLGDAMKYVAPVASSLGYSIEETAAAVAKMSDAGIQGSMAGTALRAALLSMANPVGQTAKVMEKFNIQVQTADGKMKPLPELIGHVADRFKNLTETQKTQAAAQLVGTEAASGFLSLLKIGEKGLQDYTKELENSGGVAEEVAKTQMETLKGAFVEFQSALEGLSISIGDDLLPLFTQFVRYGTDLVRTLGEMDANTVKTGLAFAGTTAAIALAVTTVTKLGIAIKGLMASMGPAGWLITGVSLLGGAVAAYKVAQEEANTVTMEHYIELDKQQKALSDTISVFDELQEKNKLTTDEMLRYMSVQQELQNTTDPERIKNFSSVLDVLRERSGLSKDEINKLIEANNSLIEQAPETEKAISATGQAFADNTNAAKELNKELLEMKRIELETQQAKVEANMAEHIRDYQKAVNEVNDALTKRNEKLVEIAAIEYNIEQLELRKKEAMALSGDERERALMSIEHQLGLQKVELQFQQESYANLQNNYNERIKNLGAAEQVLNKDKEIYMAINQNILASVGLTAERGKEKNKIDEAIAAEQQKRAEIIKSAGGVENLNSEQQKTIEKINEQIRRYYEAGQAINDNTSKQKETNTKITEGKKEAGELTQELKKEARKNIKFEGDGFSQAKQITDELGKPVKKEVTIVQKIIRSIEEFFTGGEPDKKHSGGVVGKREPLKLHVGGVPSLLMSQPMHNEVDIRALPNEMILTEAQQANLFRMIDAGFVGGESQKSSKTEVTINQENHFTTFPLSPSEIARKNKQLLQQTRMEWGD